MNREHFFTCCRAIMPECKVESVGEEGFSACDSPSGWYIGMTGGPELQMWDFGPKPGFAGGEWVTVKTEKEVFKYLKKFKEDRNEL